mmetsp:Transcript_3661/g.11001  ORF Transcript_3661/g.11001 Transcript_3661/m.11001 type:complete len:212 (+) Transcript_3661:614-1249(+)
MRRGVTWPTQHAQLQCACRSPQRQNPHLDILADLQLVVDVVNEPFPDLTDVDKASRRTLAVGGKNLDKRTKRRDAVHCTVQPLLRPNIRKPHHALAQLLCHGLHTHVSAPLPNIHRQDPHFHILADLQLICNTLDEALSDLADVHEALSSAAAVKDRHDDHRARTLYSVHLARQPLVLWYALQRQDSLLSWNLLGLRRFQTQTHTAFFDIH